MSEKTNHILEDFLLLFNGKMRGHLTQYCYVDLHESDGVYNELVQYAPYYPTREEPKLIESIIREKADFFGDVERVYELGPGDDNIIQKKTLPLLSWLAPKEYIAIDFNEAAAEVAARYVESSMPIRCAHVVQDILKQPIKFKSDGRNLLLMLGVTIGNFVDHALDSMLKNLYSSMNDGDVALISVDTCHDLEKVTNAYHNTYLHRLCGNILSVLDTYFNPKGFDKFAFQPAYKWDAEKSIAMIGVKSEQNQSFELLDKPCHISEGQELYMIQSRKFSPGKYKEIFASYGFSNIKDYSTQNIDIKFIILQK